MTVDDPGPPLRHYAVHTLDRAGQQALRQRLREAHRSYIRVPQGRTSAVLGGPLLGADGEMNGTLLVFLSDSLEAVRAFVDGDPYTQASLFAQVDIREWRWGLGQPDPSAGGTASAAVPPR